MSKPIVGVLRGGPSSEYEVSLKSGSAVLEHLPKEKYDSRDIFIDKQGTWHLRGRPIQPSRALGQVDTVFVALHGNYGEDGKIQRILESHKKPYTGSNALGSALAMNKAQTKQRILPLGVKTAHHRIVTFDEVTPQFVHGLFRAFPQPCVIKPLASGSSVGVTVARSFEDLVRGLERGFLESDTLLVEEYIPGVEATCGVLENYRNESLYAFPEIEIVPNKEQGFFTYDAKYNGCSQDICPGRFDRSTKELLSDYARKIHTQLGLRHYSRSDFIVSPKGVYFLEVNTLPGLTPTSLLPQSIAAVGCSFPDFLDHLVTLSFKT